MKKIVVQTRSKTELLDITDRVEKALEESQVKEGFCVIFAPHTTAALTVNENADPSVKEDILSELNRLVPINGRYRHTEGNAAAHIKSSIVGCSKSIIIENGNLSLGTWQGIFFCEFDGPRKREVWIKIIPAHNSST
ncbi:MAG: hypothetical protein AMJ78_01235 [Omnitrophica WOR_2 bacterium SM23_29]|nr:MAG: hypothetical protein AMJ78_01235 [Omnitrophica WOR_2 bacterium SM23_29]